MARDHGVLLVMHLALLGSARMSADSFLLRKDTAVMDLGSVIFVFLFLR